MKLILWSHILDRQITQLATRRRSIVKLVVLNLRFLHRQSNQLALLNFLVQSDAEMMHRRHQLHIPRSSRLG